MEIRRDGYEKNNATTRDLAAHLTLLGIDKSFGRDARGNRQVNKYLQEAKDAPSATATPCLV